MDCPEALEILEADSAGAWDAEPALLAVARQHVAECVACRTAWPLRAQWGRQLSAAMQAVTPPPQLAERLHALLPQPATPARSIPVRRMGRRVWLVGGTVAAVALIVGLLWIPTGPSVHLADLHAAVDVPIEGLPDFAGSFTPRLPQAWEPFFDLDEKLVRGYPAAGQVQTGKIGLVPFQFVTRRGSEPLRGRLLILPRRQLHATDVPTTGFFEAGIQYMPNRQGGWVVWTEGDLVFACLMPTAAGPSLLDKFRQSLSVSRPIG
jgi:hypothetical protein